MPENQPRPQRRRGFSWSFIFSFLIVIAIVAFMAWILFGNSGSVDTFSQVDFVNYLMNNQITEIVVTPKEETIIVIEGRYERVENNREINRSFVLRLPFDSYYEEFPYTYDDLSNLGDSKPVVADENGDATPVSLNYIVTMQQQNNDDLIVTTHDAYVTSWWDQWGPTLLMLGGSILIVIFLFSRLSSSVGASNRTALDFNKSRARRENASKVRFSDVAGADEEKTEMQEIVSYLKEPKKYIRFGAKLPKGILLVGPPGCGKTLLAKAVAGEAGVPFYSISGSDFVEMFVGVGAGRVRDMFKVAKENAPCLIFIDEIDAVGRQRGAGLGGGNDEREQTLNQLLVEMDGFSDTSGIIVIAATNRDDVLDPALLRAGRFDRKITVNYPDRKGREEIFKVHSRNKHLAKDVDFVALSKRTVGFTGADIENIMNEAAILAVRNDAPEITMAIIDEAIDRRIAGPAKSSRALSEVERRTVAFHEAGHAIIGLKLEHSDKVQKITIVPRGNTGGHVRMTPEDDRFLLTKKELIARIVGYLGGRSSEEIFFDDISTGAQNDIEVATRIARMMVTELGMSPLGPIQYENNTGSVFLGRDYTSTQKNFSTEIAFEIDKQVRKIIDDAHDKAKEIILKYKDDVTLIANTLLENESITAEQIDYLLEHRELPKQAVVNPVVAPNENVATSETPTPNSGEEKEVNKEENKGENKDN